eukprot:SAG22_NODE_4664_length_1200_cov_1.155313_3_plen_20_part_01
MIPLLALSPALALALMLTLA